MKISYEARKELLRFIFRSSCVCIRNRASVDYLLYQEDTSISHISVKKYSCFDDAVGTNRDHNDTLSGLGVLFIGDIKIFSKILNPFLITTNWISTKMSTFTHYVGLKIFIATLVHIDAMGPALIKLKALKCYFGIWFFMWTWNSFFTFHF